MLTKLQKKENENMIIYKPNDYKQKNIMSLSTKETEFNSVSINDFIQNKNNLNSIIQINKLISSEFFELQEFIGKGASGVVYKGIYKKSKKPVAIKVFIKEKHKEKREEKENLKLSQEISLSKNLHNKNVIEIYAYFNDEKKIDYSVQEYGKYGDMIYFLKTLLKRATFSETSLNYFVKQILEGLSYIHRCKIVHMDIKPDNILIDGLLVTKIIDFSVSCPYSKFNSEDLVKFPFVGTPKFMAPEIVNRTHMRIKEAEKIDIYSLGVTIYYLFYGKYPYKLYEVKGDNYDGIAKNLKNEKLEFSKDKKCSELLEDFLKKTLEKDHTKRLNIKQALNHPWIQGSKIIFDEKENINCLENFLIKIITDNIPEFNEYLKKGKNLIL